MNMLAMIPDFQSIVDSWNDPQNRHAIAVHFPIALSVLCIPLALIAAIFGGKAKSLRWLLIVSLAVLSVIAWFATETGEDAEHDIEHQQITAAAETLEHHEEMAEFAWMFAIGSLVFAIGGVLPQKKVAIAGAWLALLGSAAGAWWIGMTAHHGGKLVYEYGEGTPNPVLEIVRETAREDGDESIPAASFNDPREAFFVSTVQPILEANCWKCHNPTRRERNGYLDLITVEAVFEGGDSGPAIIPGNPDESLLVQAIRWEMPGLRMPRGTKEQLPAEEIAALEQWIRDGAVWVTIEPKVEEPPDEA